jgi:hypothetical protein
MTIQEGQGLLQDFLALYPKKHEAHSRFRELALAEGLTIEEVEYIISITKRRKVKPNQDPFTTAAYNFLDYVDRTLERVEKKRE